MTKPVAADEMVACTADVSAVIVAHNSADFIGETLARLGAALDPDSSEILVVDNNSSDPTVDVCSEVPGVHVIRRPTNDGFGAAMNDGLRRARRAHVLMMNDDALVAPDCVQTLIDMLHSSDDIGVVAPLLRSGSGQVGASAVDYFPGWAEQRHRLGRHLDFAWAMASFGMRGGRGRTSRPPAGNPPIDPRGSQDVAWLIGAALLGHSDVVRGVGGFNEAFFLYCEEIDLCHRLANAGLRRLWCTSATAEHPDAGGTTATLWDRRERTRRRYESLDLYDRIWCGRTERVVVNTLRAVGRREQPARLRYSLRAAVRPRPDLAHLRQLPPLVPEAAAALDGADLAS